MKKIDSSRKAILIFSVLLWLFMLFMNLLTPYVADDYVYRISFYDKDYIDSLSDIIPSMYVHAHTMNGRVISHGFGQLFMLWPKVVFDLFNATVYVALMFIMYRLARMGTGRESLVLYVGICCAFWYFMPVFGQVALWQIGSVNYLWALFFGTLFISPYVFRALKDRELINRVWAKVLFSVAGVLMGMYTEVTSFVCVFIGAALILVSKLVNKKSLKTWLWIPVVTGLIGYALLLSMPGEMAAKSGGMSLETLMWNFTVATKMLKEYGLVLLAIWASAMILCIMSGSDPARVWLSAVLAAGAVGGNFMLTVASYYPERCFSTTAMLLILAVAVLVPELIKGGRAALCACGGAVLVTVFAFSLVLGVYDIWETHASYTAREIVIKDKIAAGEEDLTLMIVHPQTQYSAFWGLRDLSTETADTWPNKQMAMYYGVKSIIGE